MKLEPRFIFGGSASAIGGQIYRPVQVVLDGDGAASLPITGGQSRSSLHNVNFVDIVRVGSAFTSVEGSFDNINEAVQLSYGRIEENMLAATTRATAGVDHLIIGQGPALSIELLRASLVSPNPGGNHEAPIRLDDAVVSGVTIEGHRLIVQLEISLFKKYDTRTKLVAAADDPQFLVEHADSFFMRTSFGERPTPRSAGLMHEQGTIVGTIVRSLRWADSPYPGAIIDHHSVTVPNLGRLFFGEILITDVSRRLTMLRAKLGSPVGGDVSFADVEIHSRSICVAERTTIGKRSTRVTVWYATDRPTGDITSPNDFYGNVRDESERLELGTCDVSVPDEHRIGEIERPRWWRLEWRDNPERHIVVLSVTPESADKFFASLRSRTESAPTREQMFVFIHGYNVRFDDAMRRTAQLAYDLQFQGAAVAYTWPAGDSPLSYAAAEATADWTIPHFQSFLSTLARQSGARTIHLIGHSLGNRIMASGLQRLSFVEPDKLPIFEEVVLTAPDIDRGVFRQIADAVKRTASQVTLYVSANDEALVLSAKFHAFARLGLAPPEPLVIGGIDTIDASSVSTSFLGHSYAQDTSTVLSDLFPLIKEGKRPADRFALRQTPDGYWEFKPRRR